MNLFIRQKQTHRHRKQTESSKAKGREWLNQEFEIKIYTLLYIKQITNKVRLYHTRNYAQYLAINYNGKEPSKGSFQYN